MNFILLFVCLLASAAAFSNYRGPPPKHYRYRAGDSASVETSSEEYEKAAERYNRAGDSASVETSSEEYEKAAERYNRAGDSASVETSSEEYEKAAERNYRGGLHGGGQ